MFSTNYLLCVTKKSIKRKAWKEPTKLFPNKGKRKLVVFKTKIINEIKPTLLFSWPASNLVEHFYSCLFPFLTSYVPPLGFDNYHKIAVCGPVHVPKFWHTLIYVGKYQKGYIKHHTFYLMIFLTIFSNLVLI